MPNPVARNGTVSPGKVLNHPSDDTVDRLVAIVTSNGIMSVMRNTTKSVRLKGKSRKAKA